MLNFYNRQTEIRKLLAIIVVWSCTCVAAFAEDFVRYEFKHGIFDDGGGDRVRLDGNYACTTAWGGKLGMTIMEHASGMLVKNYFYRAKIGSLDMDLSMFKMSEEGRFFVAMKNANTQGSHEAVFDVG